MSKFEGADELNKLKRQEAISKYRLMGYTRSQLARMLKVSLSTVDRDIQEITKEEQEIARSTKKFTIEQYLDNKLLVLNYAWDNLLKIKQPMKRIPALYCIMAVLNDLGKTCGYDKAEVQNAQVTQVKQSSALHQLHLSLIQDVSKLFAIVSRGQTSFRGSLSLVETPISITYPSGISNHFTSFQYYPYYV